MKKVRISRRTVLARAGWRRGGLARARVHARRQRGGARPAVPLPKRYAIVFAGQALGRRRLGRQHVDRGRRSAPPTRRALHRAARDRSRTTRSRRRSSRSRQDLMGDFSLVSGLRIPFSASSVDAAGVPAGGAFRDFHGGGAGPLLCGTRSQSASLHLPQRHLRSDRRRLQQAGQHRRAGRACAAVVVPERLAASAGRQYISYSGRRRSDRGADQPAIVFHSLFDGFMPDGRVGAGAARLRAARAPERARPDHRQARAAARQGRRGRPASASSATSTRSAISSCASRRCRRTRCGQCQAPTDPGRRSCRSAATTPASGSDRSPPTPATATSTTRARLLADLIHMAFVCDLTRVATLQITVFQSHMNVYPISRRARPADPRRPARGRPQRRRRQPRPAPGQHCACSGTSSHYAYLLDKLKNTPEGAGNVLDNSAIVFMPEAGHGLQLNDASSPERHALRRGDGAAGRRARRRPRARPTHRHRAAHPGQVLISAMQAAGYTATRSARSREGCPSCSADGHSLRCRSLLADAREGASFAPGHSCGVLLQASSTRLSSRTSGPSPWRSGAAFAATPWARARLWTATRPTRCAPAARGRSSRRGPTESRMAGTTSPAPATSYPSTSRRPGPRSTGCPAGLPGSGWTEPRRACGLAACSTRDRDTRSRSSCR